MISQSDCAQKDFIAHEQEHDCHVGPSIESFHCPLQSLNLPTVVGLGRNRLLPKDTSACTCLRLVKIVLMYEERLRHLSHGWPAIWINIYT